MTTRTTISAKETRANAVYTSIQRSRGRDKTTTTRQERRRTHRSNKVEAKAVTTRANHQERDGPLTRRSLYCTTSLLIQTLASPVLLGDFKRLSLGGYGGLRYIKSIWVERPHPGDHIPGVHIPPGAAYSRGAIRKRGILRRKWPHEKSIDSQ